MCRTGIIDCCQPWERRGQWRAWGVRRHGWRDSFFPPWGKLGSGLRMSHAGHGLLRRGRFGSGIQGDRKRRIFSARWRNGRRKMLPVCGAVGTDHFVIKRYRVISLFDLCFRLVLGPPLFTKCRKALSIRRLNVVLVTEVPVKAQPLPVVRTVLTATPLRSSRVSYRRSSAGGMASMV